MHCLLLLLPAWAPEKAQALPRTRHAGSGPQLRNAGAVPYMPKIGTLPLRFQAPAPAPDLSVRPAAASATTTELAPAESTVAAANAAAAQSTAAPDEPASALTAPQGSATEKASSGTNKSPPPILPDHAKPAVRPEDFLPYFQIPGSAAHPSDVTLFVPATPSQPAAPGTLPPSSATYTQTPR